MATGISRKGNKMTKSDDIVRMIMKILCKYNGCQIDVTQLQREVQRHQILEPNRIVSFLNDYSHHFLVQDGSVTAFTNLEICPNHCRKNGRCDEEYCGKLHVCKFFLLSQCIFSQLGTCQFGHQLDSDHNSPLIRRNLLDQLSTQDMQRLFQSVNSRSCLTMPLICRFYNHHAGCRKNIHCSHLHICQYYVDGSCRFASGCIRNHDIGNQQVLKILRKFGIDTKRRPRDIIQDLRRSQQHTSERETMKRFSSMPTLNTQGMSNQSQPIRVHRLSEGPGVAGRPVTEVDDICKYFLRNNGCWFGDACKSAHKSIPYQWQYRHGSGSEWTDFDYDSNKKLETDFRNVNCSECKIFLESESSDSDYDEDDFDEDEDGNKGEITVDFHTMEALGKDRQLKVRRLGTSSTAAVSPQVARSFEQQLTRWLWYWFNEETQEWIEYGQQGSNSQRSDVDSSDIEKLFVQEQGRSDFHVGNTIYRIKFAAMQQKNTVTGKKKYVRRRPQPIY